MNTGMIKIINFLLDCGLIDDNFDKIPSEKDFREIIGPVYADYILLNIDIEKCKEILTPYKRDMKLEELCRSDETGSTC